MDKKYELAIFIGRFQPFHNGHLSVIKQALEIADKVMIIIGSSNASQNIKNPWLAQERQQMIAEGIRQLGSQNILFDVAPDYFYDEDLWISHIYNVVGFTRAKKISLIGYEKDSSSYYLKSFPQWDYHPIKSEVQLNATDLRYKFFDWDFIGKDVPEGTYDWICGHHAKNPELYHDFREELKSIRHHHKIWKETPFPPTFNTVDSVVIHNGHILLVKRGKHPGKNKLALPGGFLEINETLLSGAMRELKEETNLEIDIKYLKDQHTFDYPSRSLRGRIITTAFNFVLPPGQWYKVQGGDDASEALWYPLINVWANSNNFYEDHAHIINYFTGI